MSKLKEKLKRYLSAEIAIDYKTCIYFFCILFFYCVYLVCCGVYSASLLCLFEMIAAAYFISYVQVYLFHNFDETEKIGKKDMPGIVCCTCLYTAVSYFFSWFGKNLAATLLFLLYMLFIYYLMYVTNKIKRIIDTENLNKMLTEFKEREKGETYE